MRDPELHVASPAGEDAAPEPAEVRIAALERELARLRGQEEGWREERARLLAALEEAERELSELPAIRAELKTSREAAYWLAAIQSSWTYRLANPLRRLRRRLGGRRGG